MTKWKDVLLAGVLMLTSVAAFGAKKPNVVFFLIDDMGYSDLGCYGSNYYETPAIDKLAREGIRFTQNYAACTVCSPTRASILSGKYPGRLHITMAIPVYGSERRENPKMRDADYVMNMPLEEFTIAEAFKEAGYTTASVGKWHVCDDEAYYPEYQGFDYNIGGNKFGNPGEYFFPYHGKWRMTDQHPWIEWNTLPDGQPGEYLTDRLTDEAVRIIEKHKKDPFFIYLSHYAVHYPLQAKEDYIKKYERKLADEIHGHSNAPYAAMIQSVDESLQKILSRLDELGLSENTIVVLASDNGGAGFATSNWPWGGNKGNYYEGGIRVPLIVRWPGKIKPGEENNTPVITTDYYPTLLELCGLDPKPEQHLDGKSFADLLLHPDAENTSFLQRDLFWHFPHYIGAVKNEPANPCTVIRSGNWKMIQSLEDSSVELYNLDEDPQENSEVSWRYPEVVKELENKLDAHRKEIKAQMPRENPDYVPEQPNVLFITIDDMNDWTTAFDVDNPIQTPNIARLAKRGAFFSRAYCSSPACNPSRSSVMTGTRPHKTGIYDNNSDWRHTLPNIPTLQKYFKENGYFVCGAGKVFHHQQDWAFHDNASFHEYLMMSLNEPYPETKLNGFDWFGSRNTDWGAWPEDVKQTADYRTSEYAIQKLRQDFDQPFFINVGIYKPHSPFFAPQEFFDTYPMSAIKMPELYQDDLTDLPSGARSLIELTNRNFGSGKGFWKGLLKAKEENPEVYEDFVRSYQACASFADAMVGRIIDALDRSPYRKNTIVVLWSDHGFHLGEKEHIEKFALWEKTTHIPFIVIAPGMTRPGTVIDKPVDMTVIYPMLAELCGLEIPGHVDGFSLVPLLKDNNVQIPPALMTYLKGNHAIRIERWRYIQYADGTEELYDHETDSNEWYNVAGKAENQMVIKDLKKYIPKENADKVPDLKR